MDYTVFTRGVEYSNRMRRTISKPIETCLEMAPSDSFCCVCIRKTENMYSGVFRIRASMAHFGAVDVSENIKDLMTKLINDISAQLQAWREHRFELTDNTQRNFADEHLIALHCGPTTCPLSH